MAWMMRFLCIALMLQASMPLVHGMAVEDEEAGAPGVVGFVDAASHVNIDTPTDLVAGEETPLLVDLSTHQRMARGLQEVKRKTKKVLGYCVGNPDHLCFGLVAGTICVGCTIIGYIMAEALLNPSNDN